MEMRERIEHTLLNPAASQADIIRLCDEAREHRFGAVCVHPSHVALCRELLKGTNVAVATVIGFPLGATSSEAKLSEAMYAMRDGAQHLDVVLNVGALKEGRLHDVEKELGAIVQMAHAGGVVVKVIIETCLLTDDEKRAACVIVLAVGADFVKTSTGFGKGGATVEDVVLLRRCVGSRAKVKASGGIRDRKTADAMVEAGADTLGTSAGTTIVNDAVTTTA